MEYIKTFLESSTIHGLAYIANGKKYVRLLWILVVIAGFTGAGYIIYQSFQSWADGPVKTTIETHPIKEITFPKVTVCPPRNTYTDLNYDLMMAENMTLDNDTRNELVNFAVEMLYDHMHDTLIANLSKLDEKYRYYNWYHGYTQITLPFHDPEGVKYFVSSATSSGTIFTKYFEEKFDEEKVETDLYYMVSVYPPPSVRSNTNVTLHLEIEKVSLKDLSVGGDGLYLDGLTLVHTSPVIYNITPPMGGREGFYYMELGRHVLPEDVRKQKLSWMPGFNLTWHYTGLEVQSEDKYDNTEYPSTKAFIRNFSNNIPK